MTFNNHYKGHNDDYQKKICLHLNRITRNNIDSAVIQYFRGVGLDYYWICQNCTSNLDDIEPRLVDVNADRFEEFTEHLSDIAGTPQILENIDERLSFDHKVVDFNNIINSKKYVYRAFYPLEDENACYFLLENILLGRLDERIYLEIIKVDFDDYRILSRLRIKDIGNIKLNKQVSFLISPNFKYYCIYNTYDQYGIVFDDQKNIVLLLDRGNYYPEQTEFPLGFILKKDKVLFVHGTDWNRLDIFDLTAGKSLTDRGNLKYEEDKYLDFFHGKLSISPAYTWLVDDGWVWAPVGVTTLLKIDDWLENNLWASEDAENIFFSEIWGRSIIWREEDILLVWGYSVEDTIIDGVSILDVNSNDELGWFPGPYNQLIYDKNLNNYLFSFDKDEGMTIWNTNTGELLKVEEGLSPHFYLKSSKSFITHLENSKFKISKFEIESSKEL